MNELISLIVPVYNVENCLRPCLDSIINQTFKDIEILLVDDGATDKSGEICDEYAKKDYRIKVIHKENGGLSDARNKGISHAKGNYLMFIDGDDIVSEDFVEYLDSLMKQSCADIGICDPVHCYPDKEIVFEKETDRKIFTSEEAICEMLYQKSFLVSAWGKIYPKEFFDDSQFPSGMLFEDSAIMYRIFDKAGKIAYGNAKLYGYMHRENSITTKKFSKQDLDILKICDQIVDYMSSRSEALQKAARSYQTAGAFRIYMNAPRNGEFYEQVEESNRILKENRYKVLKDNQIRRKMRLAVIMYLFAEPLMLVIYRKINRWK